MSLTAYRHLMRAARIAFRGMSKVMESQLPAANQIQAMCLFSRQRRLRSATNSANDRPSLTPANSKLLSTMPSLWRRF
jgi:hypothetical protein